MGGGGLYSILSFSDSDNSTNLFPTKGINWMIVSKCLFRFYFSLSLKFVWQYYFCELLRIDVKIIDYI